MPPLHHQFVSELAWADEDHVIQNRSLYRERYPQLKKFSKQSYPFLCPNAASFYGLKPRSDTQFSVDLFEQTNTKVLPGSFLSRNTSEGNPGKNRVRLALVHSLEECKEAAIRIRQFMNNQ